VVLDDGTTHSIEVALPQRRRKIATDRQFVVCREAIVAVSEGRRSGKLSAKAWSGRIL